MQEIKAYIKPHKLSEVTLALRKIAGLSGMSVSDVRSFGRGGAALGPERLAEDVLDFLPGVRLEIICHDDLVDEVVTTIEQAANTGLRGDGKIFVTSVEIAVRISTGEQGEAVV
jgi:nitrogen regulatory protein PII